MRFRDRQRGGINGVVTIRTISKETGEVLDEFVDNNVVTTVGMEHLWKRVSDSQDANNYTLQYFVLGSDYGVEEGGDWSMFAPKPAKKEYTKDNQIILYEDDPANTAFAYPSDTELQVGTILDGSYIINNFFSSETVIFYNSATIRFGDGTVFSFKRFPVRSITKVVDVQISWKFTLVDSALFDCTLIDPFANPEPNHNLGISVYAGFLGNNRILKLSDTGDKQWEYGNHTDWVTDIKVNDDFVFSVSRDMSVRLTQKADGVEHKVFNDVHTDQINRILVDGDYFTTISDDGMVKRHNYVTEELIWQREPKDLFSNPTPNSIPMAIVKSSYDGYYIVAYQDGTIIEFLSNNGAPVNRYNIDAEVVEMESTPDGDILVSIYDEPPVNEPENGYGYAVLRYSLQSDATQLVLDDYNSYSFKVIFDKTGNTNTPDFFIASDDGHVRRYDRGGNLVWQFDDHSDVIRGLAYDRYGYIYTGSNDQTLKKISPNGNQVWAYTKNAHPVSAIAVDMEPESNDNN